MLRRKLMTTILAGLLLLPACAPAPASPTQAFPTPGRTLRPDTPTAAAPASSTSTSTPTPVPSSGPASVSVMPDPAGYTWAKAAEGFDRPTDIRGSGDGSGRLFIVEQAGRIRVLQNGQLLASPLLDITGRVGSDNSEQGLLGLAFHPNFAQNGYFYVNYTDHNGDTHLARFTASAGTSDPASEKQLLIVQQPFSNHNGGSLAFGPDGYLYAGLGDGGSAGDPYGNAQSENTLLGKLLRLDVDHGDPYTIPPGNPSEASPEIWALGLRNPWRISFDRLTGDLWIGDVGQDTWEEVDRVAAGAPGGLNFGWNAMEGTHAYQGGPQPQFVTPVAEYSHAEGCSVTGGYVYRGRELPDWQGVYLYGDYCSGALWGLLDGSGAAPLFQTGFRISTFGQDDAGELYVSDYGSGRIYRLVKR